MCVAGCRGEGCCSVSALVYIVISYLTLKMIFWVNLTLNRKTSHPSGFVTRKHYKNRYYIILFHFYLKRYNIYNFPVAAIFSKIMGILDLLKPHSGPKFWGLRPEMLLVCLTLAQYQIWHFYPPGGLKPHQANIRSTASRVLHTNAWSSMKKDVGPIVIVTDVFLLSCAARNDVIILTCINMFSSS